MLPEPVIAILPFKGAEKHESEIIRNFSEDLANDFAKFQGISVLSYFSSQQLSLGEPEELIRFGVSHVITGGFKIRDGKASVNAQLINTRNGRIIYNFDQQYSEREIFTLTDQIVLQIINVLKDQLDQSILSHSYRKPEVALDAYELFLMGRTYLKSATPEDDQKAREFFERALEMQPNYARAYAGISTSYFNDWSCQLWERWEVSQNGAKKFALKAIEIDDRDYEALFILGRVCLFEGQFDQAEFYLRKSLQMNSNDAVMLMNLAITFVFLGCNEEATELYEKGCRLNPLLESKYLSYGATVYFENGLYKEALEMGKKLDIENCYVDFSIYLGAASYYLGDEEQALNYWNIFQKQFQKHIYHNEDVNKALSWHKNINPYKLETKLTDFWAFLEKHIEEKPDIPESTDIPVNANPNGYVKLMNSQVEISYNQDVIRMKLSKGLQDITFLLQNPDTDFHCTELMGSLDIKSKEIPLIDEKAKKSIRSKILDLQEEIHQAEDENNLELARRLTREYEELCDYLSRSLGLSGKDRHATKPVDRARAAVTLRIKDCIKKITGEHPQLGTHLSNSIKTGVLCSYRPENLPIWEVEK